MADQANFPDIYIDSAAAGGGTGALASPYNAFSDINWTTGGDNSVFDYYAGSPTASVNIYLKRGSRWATVMQPTTGGVEGFPLTFSPYGSGARPIIGGTSGSIASMKGFNITNIDYVTIKNIDVEYIDDHGVAIYNGEHVIVQGCNFDDVKMGVTGNTDTNYISVLNCIINETDYSGIRAQAVTAPSHHLNWTITGNSLSRINSGSNTGHAAIQTHGASSGDIANFTIQYNECDCTTYGTVGIGLDKLATSTVSNNNVLKDAGTKGEGIAISGQNVTITENYIRNPYAGGITVWSTPASEPAGLTSDITITNNRVERTAKHSRYHTGQAIALVWTDDASTLTNITVANNCLSGSSYEIQSYKKVGVTVATAYSNVNITDNNMWDSLTGPYNWLYSPDAQLVVTGGKLAPCPTNRIPRIIHLMNIG